MEQTVTAPPTDVDRMARRNALVLMIAQALNGAIPTVAISLGGLTGLYLLGSDKSLATVPVTAFTVGVAVGAMPAAALMRWVGRRNGFILGTMIAMFGGVVAGFGILVGSFVQFALGTALLGLSNSFVQQYRFAAADAGSPAQRARAISWVLVGGVASAFVGPQTVIFTRNLMAPIPFAGAFFAIPGLALLGLVTLLFLQGERRTGMEHESRSGGRPLLEIVSQPRFIVALVCGMGSYGLMSLVMTAAPLAMVACGLGQDNAALGIQWHVLGMFAPSFFTGALIVRFGKETIIAIGMVLLAGCAIVALAGLDLMNFWAALVLLGVGWNFGFIGATTMITETYRQEEKGKVQGINDLFVFGSVAVASFSSGKLLSTVGWEWINRTAFGIIAVCLLALAYVVLWGRRRIA